MISHFKKKPKKLKKVSIVKSWRQIVPKLWFCDSVRNYLAVWTKYFSNEMTVHVVLVWKFTEYFPTISTKLISRTYIYSTICQEKKGMITICSSSLWNQPFFWYTRVTLYQPIHQELLICLNLILVFYTKAS